MRTLSLVCLFALAATGCGLDGPAPQQAKETVATETSKPAAAGQSAAGNAAARDTTVQTLADARRGFTTKLVKQERDGKPAPAPPAGVMQLVQYESPIGKMSAYVTPAPTDGQKHPAIVWITGGNCNAIDECWTDGPLDNEQTAAAFRKSRIVVMFASLRGGNDSPGYKEGMFGEVDDILAAADFLAKQDYVDPHRIYLGGHSTGGTLVLLVAECSNRFRAVFSFGPVASTAVAMAPVLLYHDLHNMQETLLRSPGTWLPSIGVPTFVIEGTAQGNMQAVQWMAAKSTNPLIHFLPVNGATHFSVLAPIECKLFSNCFSTLTKHAVSI